MKPPKAAERRFSAAEKPKLRKEEDGNGTIINGEIKIAKNRPTRLALIPPKRRTEREERKEAEEEAEEGVEAEITGPTTMTMTTIIKLQNPRAEFNCSIIWKRIFRLRRRQKRVIIITREITPIITATIAEDNSNSLYRLTTATNNADKEEAEDRDKAEVVDVVRVKTDGDNNNSTKWRNLMLIVVINTLKEGDSTTTTTAVITTTLTGETSNSTPDRIVINQTETSENGATALITNSSRSSSNKNKDIIISDNNNRFLMILEI